MPYTTIDKGSKYFNIITYTGTGASNARTGVGFKPDWVWIKGRSGATDHGLYDAVRGVQKDLVSNSGSAETTQTTGLTAFGSDGFTVGALAKLNTSSATYVAWNWLGANTTVSNTSGTITSTVSANTTSGFSIVKWTGTGATGTIGHGLGIAPKLLILKDTSNAYNWYVYTSATGSNIRFEGLNNTNASTSATSEFTTTSTLITNVPTFASLNTSGANMLLYCFAEVKGYSKFGSYTGNGSTDGTFIYTGFKPAWVMWKRSDSAGYDWDIYDTARDTYNLAFKEILANANTAESSSTVLALDILSNGFKLRTTNDNGNGSGGTYIYMAFASNPFVSSKGIPTTAR